MSLTELAERVSLSVSATSARFRRLIEDGKEELSRRAEEEGDDDEE